MFATKPNLAADGLKWLRMDLKCLGIVCWLSAIVTLFGFALSQIAIGLFIGSGICLTGACMLSQKQNKWRSWRHKAKQTQQ
ncbi:hypothetical protein [Motilimonas eburnea]|uniref:hypothetical protein n=1 Tax=Motilimonas eburnea TaxID=1737488 RepID=UPI001E5A261A|nr:hypothetical protein [Motilimonas eburnea]MCE2570241.1 hypothetical protein [Motilimonas eburnea]